MTRRGICGSALAAVASLGLLVACSGGGGDGGGPKFFACGADFSPTPSTTPADAVRISDPRFSLTLPADWVFIDLGSSDVPSAITTAAGGDASLEAFLTATADSQAGKPPPRVIAANRQHFESENLLLELGPEGFRLDSEYFVPIMKAVVEIADFTIGGLKMCDFDLGNDHGRLVSYVLQDDLGGSDLAARVAVVEAGGHDWLLTSFGEATAGDGLSQRLSTIVSGFRSPPA